MSKSLIFAANVLACSSYCLDNSVHLFSWLVSGTRLLTETRLLSVQVTSTPTWI